MLGPFKRKNKMKMYAAIRKRKNGKVDFAFGCETDWERLARNLAEVDELKNYDIAELKCTVTKVIPSNKSSYWTGD
jgi:phage terminase small subunit